MKKLIFIFILLIVGCEETLEPADCAGVAGGTAVEDCAGVCGGTAVEDCAGVCGGNSVLSGCDNLCNSTAVEDCAGICGGCSTVLENCGGDNYFNYNQSSLQAFYFFTSVIIDGVLVDSDDWVGAFKDDVCVGARKWDTSQCGSGVCDLPAMGDDGNDATVGYMTSGDMPSFKIYDASENKLYDAVASENFSWANRGTKMIESLTTITNSLSNCP